MQKNILITGLPRSGKSTLLKKVITPFDHKVGFITSEIRNNNERTGFLIETHLGETTVLASVDFHTEYKVSRYCVDVQNLETAVQQVKNYSTNDLLYLDEIGQMELFSDAFKALALEYLNSQNTCIATLSKIYSDSFIESIKQRPDIILVELNEENRLHKEEFVSKLLQKLQS